MGRFLCFFLLAILLQTHAGAQGCTTLGQTPVTAFPACGTKPFDQSTVPVCGTKSVPGACTDVTDKNPFWYQFTCYKTGTLAFTIDPVGADEDYDWQLFDITGHSPNDVYTNASLTVTANWSGTYGPTGASSTGKQVFQCGTDPADNISTFAPMPLITVGHVYLLLISHFSDSQSGYTLSFGDIATGGSEGSSSITDPNQPKMQTIDADCESIKISIGFNKHIQCASLASDGSDFEINAPGVKITSAVATSCNASFNLDEVVLTLDKPLVPGSYQVKVKNGKDGNTLLDNCQNAVVVGNSIGITIFALAPTPMDSLTQVKCAPQTLELVFKKPMRCNAIAPDGSDFKVTGPYPISVVSAAGVCDDGISKTILVTLAMPVVHQGTYTLTLVRGIDGNTIIDNCGQETPAGSSLNFTVNDTVSAMFDAQLLYGCKQDTITVQHDGRNNVNKWEWSFWGNLKRTAQTAQVTYTSYGEKDVTLAVSNGFCADTTTQIIDLDNELKARFISPEVACPNDLTNFTDTSIGSIISYQWDFGLGYSIYQKDPPGQIYPQGAADKTVNIQLVVKNSLGCSDTAVHPLKIVYTCYIAVPSAFTPNGDGINDYLYPLNAYKADNLIFRVFNRYGQLVYATTNWTKKWDGKINGQPQANGTYIWMLSYTQHDTGKKVAQKGTTVLIK